MQDHDYRKSIPKPWTHNEICRIIERYINDSNVFENRVNEISQSIAKDEIWENNHDMGLFELDINLLNKIGLEPEKVESVKTSCSTQIAILNELGFFNLPKVKELAPTQRDKMVSRLLNRGVRDIRGNINVLNPVSKEDSTKYTASNEGVILKAKKIINE